MSERTGIPVHRRRWTGGGAGGFTLIEVMVVVMIIGMLLTAMIAAVLGFKEKAKAGKALGTTKEAVEALAMAIGDAGDYSLEVLVEEVSNSAVPELDVMASLLQRQPPAWFVAAASRGEWRGPYLGDKHRASNDGEPMRSQPDPWGQPYLCSAVAHEHGYPVVCIFSRGPDTVSQTDPAIAGGGGGGGGGGSATSTGAWYDVEPYRILGDDVGQIRRLD